MADLKKGAWVNLSAFCKEIGPALTNNLDATLRLYSEVSYRNDAVKAIIRPRVPLELTLTILGDQDQGPWRPQHFPPQGLCVVAGVVWCVFPSKNPAAYYSPAFDDKTFWPTCRFPGSHQNCIVAYFFQRKSKCNATVKCVPFLIYFLRRVPFSPMPPLVPPPPLRAFFLRILL